MAVRLDFYRADGVEPGLMHGTHDLSEEFDPGDLVPLGYVSASDDDELELVGLLERLDANIGLFGLGEHGWGVIKADQIDEVSSEARTMPAAVAGSSACSTWEATILAALGEAAAVSADFYWRTRFDRAGSIDDGDDEFPTSAGR